MCLYALLMCRGDISKAAHFFDLNKEEFEEKMSQHGIFLDSKFQKALEMLYALSYTERMNIFRYLQGRMFRD